MKSNLSGVKKLAILGRAVGFEALLPAIRAMKLSEATLQQIQRETPDTVSKGEAIAVLQEFNAATRIIVGGSKENLMDALEEYGNAFSDGKSARKLNGFKRLAAMPPTDIYAIINHEQALHQAIILLELPEKVSADTFALFDIENQAKITNEAHNASTPTWETIFAINQTLEETLASQSNKAASSLERIFAFTDNMDEEHLEAYLSNLPDELSEKIKANVLTFSHIKTQDEKVLSEILGELSTTCIAFAFCESDAEMLEKIKKALTATKAQDVEFMITSSVNKDDTKQIKTHQREVIKMAKKLSSQEKIVIVR